jgi:diguanylate cyclase (GGDEF)-like protein
LEGGNSTPVESTILRNVVRLLDGLKETSIGLVIYDQVARLLAGCESEHDRVERNYISLIYFLLQAYAKNPSSDHVLQVTANLLRAAPTPPLTLDQVDAVRKQLLGDGSMPPLAGTDANAFGDALTRLLSHFGAPTPAQPAPARPRPEEARAAPARAAAPAAAAEPEAVEPEEAGPEAAEPEEAGPEEITEQERRTRSREKTMQRMLVDEEAHAEPSPPADRRVNSAYRLHLDRKRDEIEKLQETLAQKVREAINQNKEFGVLLEIERGALQQADSIQEIESLRKILIGGIDELIQGQRALAKKLRGSNDYLTLVKSDSERLHEELNKVRLLSLTDEFTGLPNRRAFMRRLEDEIGRAQRYGTPLALAIMDLDEFKAINDTHGHAAGDEVLRCYASSVLSVFRHHDMVARYGGEEFSVLLPNTGQEGASCALRKVQKRVTKTHCVFAGKTLTLPNFSAGLTLYVPGEPPSVLIDRADKALYTAKRLGRNRVEVELGAVTAASESDWHDGNGG